MCNCTIPTLAAAREGRTNLRPPGAEPSYVILHDECPAHGRASRPDLWFGARGTMSVTPVIWFGLDALTREDAPTRLPARLAELLREIVARGPAHLDEATTMLAILNRAQQP